MTRQMTVVVIGALRVKMLFRQVFYYLLKPALMQIDHEIFSMVLLSFCWFKMDLVEEGAQVLVNHLEDYKHAQWLGKTDQLDMILIVFTGP